MTTLASGRTTGTATAVPSATVVLVRPRRGISGDDGGGDDGAGDVGHGDGRGSGEGLEVFLQERTIQSDFAGGAYVFPGGKVDDRDRAMDDHLLGEVDATWLQACLGTTTANEAVALAVAAVRESFEEAGVLLARRGGDLVDGAFLAAAHTRAMRSDLADRSTDTDWRPWLAAHDLVLDLAALAPFAWWITPHGVHRRYSTRFFVAVVPPDQQTTLGHDGREMTDSVWLGPGAALAAGQAGERMMIYPTRMTLARLAEHADVAAVMAAARSGDVDLRPIVPLVRRGPDGPGVQHPDGGPVAVV